MDIDKASRLECGLVVCELLSTQICGPAIANQFNPILEPKIRAIFSGRDLLHDYT